MTVTMDRRVDRLDALIRGGRLLRGAWTGVDDSGREAACLLAALSPEAGKEESASACPAEVMPLWLAELTPFIDDRGSIEHWPAVVARYAALARRWHVLDADDWRRLDYACRAVAVREARRWAGDDARALAAIDRVLALLARDESGDEPSVDEWRAARAAEAVEAATAAVVWAARAAGAAARAASDRIIDGVLDALETAIGHAEAQADQISGEALP